MKGPLCDGNSVTTKTKQATVSVDPVGRHRCVERGTSVCFQTACV